MKRHRPFHAARRSRARRRAAAAARDRRFGGGVRRADASRRDGSGSGATGRRPRPRRRHAAAARLTAAAGRSTGRHGQPARGDVRRRRPAAVCGAARAPSLALRPRRRGTPVRQPAVVQTQIVLAVVGALIMLVVGASLARAFGIVGAANLIRYRSKIDDPKDAVVMLCALSVGLAAGVGLYGLAHLRHRVPRARAVDHRGLRAADARLRAVGEARGTGPRSCGRASRRCCGASRPTTSCAASRKRKCRTSSRRRSSCTPTACRMR